MRVRRALVVVAALLAVGGCGGGGSGSGSGTPSPTPLAHSGQAVDYLLRLDELTLPGFTAASAGAPTDATTLAAGDSALASALAAAGVRSAASARYFRSVPTLATANGPIDVLTTVVVCGGASAALSLFDALTKHFDAVPGAIAVSTGHLGDAGHGDLLEAAQQTVTVAQVTLTWRSGDLVTMLVVRERDTGSPVQDALIVARPQVLRLSGG